MRWNEWLGLGAAAGLLTLFTVPLPMPVVSTGTLDVYPGELLLAALGAALVFLFASGRYRPSAHCRRMLWVILAFLAWFVVVSVVRVATDEVVTQSVLVLRSTLIPLVAYFLVDARMDSSRRVVAGLLLLNVGINLVHLPDWYDLRESTFLANSVIYAGLITMLIPINIHALVKDDHAGRLGTVLRWAATVNLVFAIVFPIWVGSRSLTAVCVAVFCLSALALVRTRTVAVALLGVTLVASATHAVVWATNPYGAAHGIYRVVPPPEWADDDSPEAIEKTRIERDKADFNRAFLREESLDEIREDPLFTDGRVFFDYENDFGESQAAAHNFALEHTNAYGVVGFLLYLGMFVAGLWPGWTRLRLTTLGAAENVTAFLTLGAALTFSMVQPTMLIMTLVVPLWLVIGALKQTQVRVMADDPPELVDA